jgi:hypothetical protein
MSENFESLRNVRSELLLPRLKDLVRSERKITNEILFYLREVEARKIHLELGFSSLYELCVGELGYSSSSAMRRISAMRLLKAMPEIERKLFEGSVNLSTLNQLQSFIKREEKTENGKIELDDKRELLAMIENKSQLEVETALAIVSPKSAIIPLREKIIAEDLVEIRLVVSKKVRNKIERMKSLNSHRSTDIVDVLERALDLAIEKLESAPKKVKQVSKVIERKAESPDLSNSRYIKRDVVRTVRFRAQNQCEFVSSSGKRCRGTLFLETDHKVPFAKGGRSELYNLQVLCSAHNKLKAQRQFGY